MRRRRGKWPSLARSRVLRPALRQAMVVIPAVSKGPCRALLCCREAVTRKFDRYDWKWATGVRRQVGGVFAHAHGTTGSTATSATLGSGALCPPGLTYPSSIEVKHSNCRASEIVEVGRS